MSDLPGRKVLTRYLTGNHRDVDQVALQDLANRLTRLD